MSERPGEAGGGRDPAARDGAPLVLYRCPTPTNVLCPCGAVARRLNGLGLRYDTQRVPYRRVTRPEIEELTRQRRVPVLIDGDEVVHDSRRILQYLDWAYEKPKKPAGEGPKRRRPTEKKGSKRKARGERRPARPPGSKDKPS